MSLYFNNFTDERSLEIFEHTPTKQLMEVIQNNRQLSRYLKTYQKKDRQTNWQTRRCLWYEMCNMEYMEQTQRLLKCRMKEHKTDSKLDIQEK